MTAGSGRKVACSAGLGAALHNTTGARHWSSNSLTQRARQQVWKYRREHQRCTQKHCRQKGADRSSAAGRTCSTDSGPLRSKPEPAAGRATGTRQSSGSWCATQLRLQGTAACPPAGSLQCDIAFMQDLIPCRAVVDPTCTRTCTGSAHAPRRPPPVTAPRESSMLPMPLGPLSQLAGIQRSCCSADACCTSAAAAAPAAAAGAGGSAVSGAGASARSAAAACWSHRAAATRCPVRLHGRLGWREGARGRRSVGSAAGLRPCRRASGPLLQAGAAARAATAGMLCVGRRKMSVGGGSARCGGWWAVALLQRSVVS